MLVLLQKYQIQLHLLLLALLGVSCGLLTAVLLEGWIEPPLQLSDNRAQTSAETVQGHDSAALNLILRNNIFAPEERDSGLSLVATKSGDSGSQQASTGPVASSRGEKLTLLGTVVAADDSLGLIQVGEELGLFHLQDELPGGGTITDIRRNLVEIRQPDGTLTSLTPAEEEAGRAPAASRSVSESPVSASGEIKQVADNRWVVSRDMVEQTRANISRELRLAQMQPRVVDGQTNGFLVRMIRRSSILNKLGLQRGDVVLSINGIDLDSPEKALQVFQQLREARRIDVAVERNGQPVEFSYQLN